MPKKIAGSYITKISGVVLVVFFLSTLIYILKFTSGYSSKETYPQEMRGIEALAAYKFPGCAKKTGTGQIVQKDGIRYVQPYLKYPNNKFGLYVYSVEDLIVKADEMVNGNGGDWGYVLIPYNIHDFDDVKWFKLFRGLSQLHLIPIIQLWDLDLKGDVNKQIDESAIFLNSLPWPIQSRYVSVYNEPNDQAFWGGKANPEQYAYVLNRTADQLHSLDSRFFVMNGAFNASARRGRGYIDEERFLVRMNRYVPGIFNKIDGWASHPYPQPNFSGKPYGKGRDSVRAYEWELKLLKHYFGVTDLPVFITETGWAHAEGKKYNKRYWPENKTAEFYSYAFKYVWLPDARVIAVTPFTIIYEPPYDYFSFIKKDGGVYAPFSVLRDFPKKSGIPPLSPEHVDYIKSLPKC